MSSQHFTQIPRAEIQRSSFDRSHGHKTTINARNLYPIFLDEALPGDTFNLKMHAIARLSTPIYPIMDNMYLDTFFFAVPYRLIWDNWEKFNGAQASPGDSTDYTIPQMQGPIVEGTLHDYFGLPLTGDEEFQVSGLPGRAYNLIWDSWFRDQNLSLPPNLDHSDATVDNAFYAIKKRTKRHDYFTSALPWPQKGDAVDIPLGTTAPVISAATGGPTFQTAALANPGSHLRQQSGTIEAAWSTTGTGLNNMIWDEPDLVADLSNATAATINTLRQAFQIQKILERDARGGTRYTEILKAHFGVTSPDARLQRPEYLGGYSTPINIAQIHQTESTDSGTTPLGQVGAIGTAVLNGGQNGFVSSFTEHCIIIGLVNVRTDMTYQQRVDRSWSRLTRFDYYWPALAHIGEQAILNKEIYWSDATSPTDGDDVWGYQERYAEYRYKPSMVTGQMRSLSATPLDAWHLAYDFDAQPLLNAQFIADDPPVERVVAVPSEPLFILDTWFDLQCARPMPMYGVPGLIDHF